MHIKNAFRSILFFSKLFFVKKEYDVIFIYRNTFIRRGGTNQLLKPFMESCKREGLRTLLLESRHQQKRSGFRYPCNHDAVPYNLINYLQKKLRNHFSKPGLDYSMEPLWKEREKRVANVLHRLFFGHLKAKLFVTLVGNTNMVFLKYLYGNSLFVEYQHGIFWCQDDPIIIAKNSFLREEHNRDTIMLLYGDGFAKIHASCPEARGYPDKNIKVIGSYFTIPEFTQKQNSKTILYTLQNIDMQSNERYYRTIKELIACNAEYLQRHRYHILFKNHPRYERDDPLLFDEEYPFVSFMGDEEPMDMLDDISIHITSKSTTALDAALHSVPTIFIDMLDIRSPKKIFFDQYHYPLNDFRVENPPALEKVLQRLEDQDYYSQCGRKVYEWGREYYQDFDEQVFLDLLPQQLNTF